MKLLLDAQISHQVAEFLRKQGHDVREVRGDALLGGASDETLIQTAWREGRLLISASRVFARLLSRSSAWRPGAVLLLGGAPHPRVHKQILQSLFQRLPEPKLATSLIIVEGHRARVYPLVSHPPASPTPELLPRPEDPLPPPVNPAYLPPQGACPVCGHALRELHTCKQVCPACGYLSSCSMD